MMAKEGEHGNVIYIVPPICITEEDDLRSEQEQQKALKAIMGSR